MNLSIEIIITPEFGRWYPKFYWNIYIFYLNIMFLRYRNIFLIN
jgi:hypothetical protein